MKYPSFALPLIYALVGIRMFANLPGALSGDLTDVIQLDLWNVAFLLLLALEIHAERLKANY